MDRIRACAGAFLLLAWGVLPMAAQQVPAAFTRSAVPQVVNFSGALSDVNNKPLTGVIGVTFALYKDPQGGVPLWMETQSVQPNKNGQYSVTLGATTSHGLPADVFISGEARWLGVQVQGQSEQPRVLLVAVPYALKSGDAETLGGLPASAFLLAPAPGSGVRAEANAGSASSIPPPAATITGAGTTGFLPDFTGASTIGNSAIFQTGTSPTAKVGINNATPGAALDVTGGATVRGLLFLPTTGTATATLGKPSQPEEWMASVFNKTTSTAVTQAFQLKAEPVGNNTTTATGSLNLLFGQGTSAPAETGLKISNKGIFTFAVGQTFPGTGAVKSVGLSAPASDFTVSGSPVTTTGTLNFAWNVAPTNLATANAIVKRDGFGSISANVVNATSLGASEATISSGSANPLNVSSSSVSATTIFGFASSTSGAAWGVEGDTNSNASDGYGVFGFAANGTGTAKGVFGEAASNTGVGVYGQNGGTESSVGSGTNLVSSAGVWGDGGIAGTSVLVIPGVVGTATDSIGGFFENNSSSGFAALTGSADLSTGFPFFAFNSVTLASCNIDSAGNINCTGTKNAVVPIEGGKRKVALSAIESPKNWFEDFGSGELSGGSAVIAIDPDFIQTVNTEKNYMVIPVPNGECKGLYVTNKTPTSFEVRELGGGTSSIRFDYRIVALRRNYENVRFADHTNDPDPMKHVLRRNRPVKQEGRPALSPAKTSALLQRSTEQGAGK